MYIADHVACEAARERAISDQGTDCQDMRIARDGFVNERRNNSKVNNPCE